MKNATTEAIETNNKNIRDWEAQVWSLPEGSEDRAAAQKILDGYCEEHAALGGEG